MKIIFATPVGGHLTEIQKIFSEDVIKNCEVIYLTEDSKRTTRF